MAYVTQSELEAVIPAPHLVDAMDDDGDGVADAGLLDQVMLSASTSVDAYLSGLFQVPFAEPPPAVREATLVFAAEMVYARRAVGDEKNPFGSRARFWRERLQKVGAGELPLSAATARAFTPGAAITEASRVDGSTT